MKRLMIILKENQTLHEMMIGIVFANVILAVIAYFMNDRASALYGVLIGSVTAVIFVIHMAVTIDDALCLDEKGATVQFRKNMIIRYVFVCIVVSVAAILKVADPIFLVLSVITIKAGAYLQPCVHRIFNRR